LLLITRTGQTCLSAALLFGGIGAREWVGWEESAMVPYLKDRPAGPPTRAASLLNEVGNGEN